MVKETPPHPFALFTLIPLNDTARAISKDANNSHLTRHVYRDDSNTTETGLQVGFHINSGSKSILATLGRDNADIVTAGPHFSRIQCSFEVNETTNVIMLRDRSSAGTTRFHGPSALPFMPGQGQRRIIVDPDTNLHLGFGGSRADMAQFRLSWHMPATPISNCLQFRTSNPRKDPTIDCLETIPATQRVTRFQTPHDQARIRYIDKGIIGRGTFGTVYQTVDVDTGMVMAMKEIKIDESRSRDTLLLKREVALHRRLCHVSACFTLWSAGC